MNRVDRDRETPPPVNDDISDDVRDRAFAIIGDPVGYTEWDYVIRIAQLEKMLAEATGK